MNVPLRKGWCPGALRPMEAKDGLLVRLRITGGIVPAATAHALADLAERHGNGLFDLSARANLQMRGVGEASLAALQADLAALGLLDASAAAESIRNVIASPLAGLHDGPEIRPIVAALEARLAVETSLHALPGKFGFLVDDGSLPSLARVSADVRFGWEPETRRFAIGLGGTKATRTWIGLASNSDLVEQAVRVAHGALRLMREAPDRRRMRDLIAVFGADRVARACGGVVQTPEPIQSHHSIVVGRQTFNRLRVLGLAAPFGRLDARMLRAAAELAARSHPPLPQAGQGDHAEHGGGGGGHVSFEKGSGTDSGGGSKARAPSTDFGGPPPPRVAQGRMCAPGPELRLTPWRTLLLPGATDVAAAAHAGFIVDAMDPRLRVATCVGARGCARGSTDTHADAAAFADLAALLSGDTPLHVSGCEKGCAKAGPSVITLVGRDGRYDLVRNGRASDRPSERGLDHDGVRRALAMLEPA